MHCLQEPRAKMPLCSVTAQPGALRRSNNVNKRADEEQKINKPALVPVRIAATRKLKNYTWHMLPGCTQALLFSSEIVATRYKENQDLQKKKKNQFTNPGEVTKMSFSSASLRLLIYFYGLKHNSKEL